MKLLTIITAVAVAGCVCAEDKIAPPDHPLFKGAQIEEAVPDSLVQAYASFAKTVKEKPDEVGAYCLSNLRVSHEKRAAGQEHHGDGPNVPFLKTSFSERVMVVSKTSNDCWLIRTGSSAIWFVHTHSGDWKIYSWHDKPIE